MKQDHLMTSSAIWWRCNILGHRRYHSAPPRTTFPQKTLQCIVTYFTKETNIFQIMFHIFSFQFLSSFPWYFFLFCCTVSFLILYPLSRKSIEKAKTHLAQLIFGEKHTPKIELETHISSVCAMLMWPMMISVFSFIRLRVCVEN